MQFIINKIEDIYINFYIYAQKKYLSGKSINLLNEQIKEIAYDLLGGNPIEKDLKKINYKVIREYKNIKNSNKSIKSEQERIVLAVKNVQNQMYINLIPKDPIKKTEWPQLNNNKIKYIEALKLSGSKEDKKIIKLLELEDLQQLATKFDA